MMLKIVAKFVKPAIGAYTGMQFVGTDTRQWTLVELEGIFWADNRQTFVGMVQPFEGPLCSWIHDLHVCEVREA